jgi:hypothetical protein
MHEEKQGNIFYKTPVITLNHGYFKDMYDFDSFLPEWKRLRLVNGTIVYEPRWFHQILEDDAKAKNPQVKNGYSLFDILFLVAKCMAFLLLLLLTRVLIKFVISLRRVRWQNVEETYRKFYFRKS